jgi:hypothetical protein
MSRLYSDDSPHLDQFGLLLLLSVASVAGASLIDLDNPTAELPSEIGWVVASLLTGATLVVATRASGMGKWPTRIVDIVAGVMVVAAIVISFASDLPESSSFFISTGRPSLILVIIAALAPVVVTRRLFRHDAITKQTLYGALAAYLLVSMGFNYAFQSVAALGVVDFFGQVEPTTSFMYFSLVTMTTLGYGDLAPAGEFGRFLATAEAIIGQVFLVTVVARIVSKAGGGFGFKVGKETSTESPSTGTSS